MYAFPAREPPRYIQTVAIGPFGGTPQSPSQAPSQGSSPSQAPAQAPFPSQAPAQAPFPSQAPAQAPFPSQAPAQAPSPSQAPAQASFPSQAPAQPPSQFQVPAQPPSQVRATATPQAQTQRKSKTIHWDRHPELTYALFEIALDVKECEDMKRQLAEMKDLSSELAQDPNKRRKKRSKHSVGASTESNKMFITTQSKTYTQSMWRLVGEKMKERFRGQDDKYNGLTNTANARKCQERVAYIEKWYTVRQNAIKMLSGVYSPDESGQIHIDLDQQLEAVIIVGESKTDETWARATEAAKAFAIAALEKPLFEDEIVKYINSKIHLQTSVLSGENDMPSIKSPTAVNDRVPEREPCGKGCKPFTTVYL